MGNRGIIILIDAVSLERMPSLLPYRFLLFGIGLRVCQLLIDLPNWAIVFIRFIHIMHVYRVLVPGGTVFPTNYKYSNDN